MENTEPIMDIDEEITCAQPIVPTVRIIDMNDRDINFELDIPDTENNTPSSIQNGAVDFCLASMDHLLSERHEVAKVKWDLSKCKGNDLPKWLKMDISLDPSFMNDCAKAYLDKSFEDVKIVMRSELKDLINKTCATFLEESTGKVTALLVDTREKIGYGSAESGILRNNLNTGAEALRVKWQREFQMIKMEQPKPESQEPQNYTMQDFSKGIKELKEIMEGLKSTRGRGGYGHGRGRGGPHRGAGRGARRY